MKVKQIYNAGCVYESQGATLLADPWLTDGAFEGSWAAYPPLKTKPKDIADVDYLYISHLHPDHYDSETLRAFRRNIPLLVYESSKGLNYLKNKLMAAGFTNLIPLKDGQSYELPPFKVTAYGPFWKSLYDPSQLGNFLDSALVIEAERQLILNANDNTPTMEAASKLRKHHGPFKLAQIKDSIAGPYPSCFNQLSFFKKQEEALRLVSRQTDHALKIAEALDAKFFQPFASQYRLQGSLSWKNAYLGIGDPFKLQTKMAKEFEHIRPCILMENDEIDLTSGKITYRDKNTMDFLVWEKLYNTKKYPYELDPLPPHSELKKNITLAFEKLTLKQQQLNYFPDITFNLLVNEPNYYVSSQVSLRSDNKIPGQKITASLPARLLHRILNRKAHWNNATVGCHVEFTREPILPYDPDLDTLLSFFHL